MITYSLKEYHKKQHDWSKIWIKNIRKLFSVENNMNIYTTQPQKIPKNQVRQDWTSLDHMAIEQALFYKKYWNK